MTRTQPPETSLAQRVIGHDRRRDCLMIAVVWVALALLLRPFQDTPFIDDWVYAWPVEQLLLGRSVKVLDYSTSLNLVQALWGALFSLPAGFSFTALRVSTWTAALLCLWSLYLLLRDLHISRRDTLLAVSTLALNPMFLILSISFMTDIPFLACMTGALLGFVRATSHHSTGWLWMASLLATLSMGIRLIGLVAPIAMTVALLAQQDGWGRHRFRFLVPLSAFAALIGMAIWHHTHTEYVADLSDTALRARLQLITLYAIPTLPHSLLAATTFVAGALGATMLPLTVGWWSRERLIPTAGICALLWLCVWVVQLVGFPHSPPLSYASTWALEELGATEPLVPNATPFAPPAWATWAISAIALASGASVLCASLRRPRTVATVFLAWVAFGSFLLIAVLWFFYDRYALPLVPVAMVFLLNAGPLRRPGSIMAVVALLGLWGLVGMRDHLHYNAAVWQAVHHLRSVGVPASEIDGGYVVNGWLQYAHPDRAARDANGGVAVPMINVTGTLRYQISNSLVPGRRVVAAVPYTRWLGRSGTIYILEGVPPVD